LDIEVGSYDKANNKPTPAPITTRTITICNMDPPPTPAYLVVILPALLLHVSTSAMTYKKAIKATTMNMEGICGTKNTGCVGAGTRVGGIVGIDMGRGTDDGTEKDATDMGAGTGIGTFAGVIIGTGGITGSFAKRGATIGAPLFAGGGHDPGTKGTVGISVTAGAGAC